MKFITIIEYGAYIPKERVFIKKDLYNYFSDRKEKTECTFFVSAIVLTTKGFYIDLDDNIIQTCHDTDSYQYRPKAIYKNKKGYYYKLNTSERVYLNKKQEIKLINYIELAKIFKYD